MLIERNLLTGFGVIWNSGPRLPGVPGVAKLFHVAPDSVHGSVTWYRVSGSPWFWMKSTRVAFTTAELEGICPSPRPTIDGNLTRALHTMAEGQPDTLSATGSVEAPRTFTFARVV